MNRSPEPSVFRESCTPRCRSRRRVSLRPARADTECSAFGSCRPALPRIDERNGKNGAGGNRTPVPDSQQGASTRVVAGLFSPLRRAATPCASGQPPVQSRPRARRRHARTSPISASTALSGVERCSWRRSGRQCVLRIGSYEWCVLFTRPARPSTRHAKPSLPGRNRSAPVVKDPSTPSYARPCARDRRYTHAPTIPPGDTP